MRIYHIIHPTWNGKKRWGYYWRERGKRVVRVVHPRTGQPFRSKREVELWIRELQEGESAGYGVRVCEIAEFMFLPTSEWARRRARKRDGQELSPHTLHEYHMIVQRYSEYLWSDETENPFTVLYLRAPDVVSGLKLRR